MKTYTEQRTGAGKTDELEKDKFTKQQGGVKQPQDQSGIKKPGTGQAGSFKQ